MKLFSTVAQNIEQYRKVKECLNEARTPALCVGLSAIHKAHFIYAFSEECEKNILVITPDEASAARLSNDINAMAGEEISAVFPSRDFVFRKMEGVSLEYEQARLGILSRLIRGEIKVLVCSFYAAMTRTVSKLKLVENTFEITLNSEIPLEELKKKLVNSGYVMRPQIDSFCQFSVRGGIIDIFPPNEHNPIRIEYWGDDIDSISYFELDSQRRTEKIERIEITPAREVSVSNDELIKKLEEFSKNLGNRKATLKAKEKIENDLELLRENLEPSSFDKYFPLVFENFDTITDYFEDAPLFVSEITECKENAKGVHSQYSEDLKILFDDGELCKGLDRYLLTPEETELKFTKHRIVYFDTFARTGLTGLKEIVTLNPLQSSGWNGDINLLKSDLIPLLEQGYCCCVMAGTEKAASNLANDLVSAGINAQFIKDVRKIKLRSVFVISGTLGAGFEYPSAKFSLITTGKTTNAPYRKIKKRKGEEIRSLADLTVGDYVVHVAHGIGIFDGIHKLDLHGIIKDYIKIKYAASDTLYVPVTQLDLVSKYIGPREDSKVKINRLHSGEWLKTRQRVRKAVDDMADELLKLYAERMSVKGYAFSPDTEYQKDFEAHFEYQETDDQLRCAEEIKADMEKDTPMERLLCGDVGFGKTEVALRAAFKCIMDGKQCAVLCPTTILSWQHYQTFISRFSNFPVEVELLSRFRTPKQQKEIIKRIEKGLVDIVVGTHRLVSKDIKFKDLGLAIIDEEQRFGVAHKERFKEMFSGVDMLTLSATPIPRTLNMAMSGIRDMSVIEEAPQNRHPVQTYVIEHDNSIIMQALRKELNRGGQVYYIHNNTESIYGCAVKIREQLPEARVAVAHGKMGEDELSKVWKQMMDHEIDILVSTTIIETGVDIANCNTLIIENADRMGLSQLYQLRGRVGRSTRRAFAYFTFQRGKVLTEIATKRLNAIREFTKFGSGFRIALRDLEIRGAGNILGTRQHGHMEAVGYDMYLRLLSEAVAEKRGEAPEIQVSAECLVDLQIDAHIPEDYIDSVSQRIDIYRKIASVKTDEDSMDVIDELIDRFGEPPKSVKGLVDVALLRNTASQFGFKEITQKGDTLHFVPEKLDMNLAFMLNSKLKGRGSINAGNNPYISVKMKDRDSITTLREVIEILKDIKDNNPLDNM